MCPAPSTDLFAQLTDLTRTFAAPGDIACRVELHPEHLQVNSQISDVVFRTVRELLTNVREHACAENVEVSSSVLADGSVAITVADDGIGLPRHKRRGSPLDETGGIGLWSIDQRLGELDAVLDIQASTGKGTRATVILPSWLLSTDEAHARQPPRVAFKSKY